MWYITKGLAPFFLCYTIFLFLSIQVNGQTPNLLPPVPDLTQPVPNLTPPVPNLLLPVPDLTPPVPNLLLPVPDLTPPVPNLIPPVPKLKLPVPSLIPHVPKVILPVPKLIPPVPNLIPSLPNLPEITGLQSPPLATETCPKDTVKMKVVCANLLGVPVLPVGAIVNPLKSPCCKFIEGLVDLEAAVCFCRALSFNNTEPKINVPVSVVFLLNYCRKDRPPGFVCASS